MSETMIPIPGRLHSVASEGHVAGADEIYDDTQSKLQSTINSEVISALEDKYEKPSGGIPTSDLASVGVANGLATLDSTGKLDSSQMPAVDSFPSQSGQSGKFLTTDGTDVSWGDVTIPTVDQNYSASSANAQSGTAVAGAISGKANASDVAGKANKIGTAFDTETAYVVGDYVTYDSKLWKCTTDHSAGAWDAVDFTEVTGNVLSVDGSGDIKESGINLTSLSGKADKIESNPFSDEEAYEIGDYVTYSGDLYKCTTAHEAGAWNSSDFTLVTDNFMAIDANGNIKDSGKNQNSFQTPLTFDTTPTANSTNPVTSGGTYTAMSELDEKIKFLNEQLLIPDAERVIMTTETNPEVLAICHAQGWCADSRYMTYAEAQAVTNIGTVFKNNTDITHFEELQYFAITAFADNALSGCTNLTKIGLPPTLTTYGRGVFLNTNRINEVYIRDLTKFCEESIGTDSWGWESCPGRVAYSTRLFLNGMLVTDLVIPEGTSSIMFIFRNMIFNSVTLPKSLNSIGYRTFASCGISDVIFKSDTVTEFVERDIDIDSYADSDPRFLASRVFLNNTELTGSFNIPSGVTKIGAAKFRSCKNITAITIPNTVTSIGFYAIANCVNLTSITIPNSVLTIGTGAISGCTNLTTLDCGTNFNPFSGYNTAGNCRNLSVIKMRATTAPDIDIRQYSIGDLVEGTKYLYVPANSTGYDTGNWATLCSNLGFTLSKTL